MRTLLLAAAVLAVRAAPTCAQVPLTAAPLVTVPLEAPVYLSAHLRLQLNVAWDDRNAQQPERGYCLVMQRGVVRGDSVWIAAEAYRVVPQADDPYSVDVDCGPNQTILHTHTPNTCEQDSTGTALLQTCHMGGRDAYLCFPSGRDRALLAHDHFRFALIQCDRNAFIAYYPEAVVTPPKADHGNDRLPTNAMAPIPK